MTIPYYELKVRKCKTYFWMSYCLLPSCPEYIDPTVDVNQTLGASKKINLIWCGLFVSPFWLGLIKHCQLLYLNVRRNLNITKFGYIAKFFNFSLNLCMWSLMPTEKGVKCGSFIGIWALPPSRPPWEFQNLVPHGS